jgi:hypothetical protein
MITAFQYGTLSTIKASSESARISTSVWMVVVCASIMAGSNYLSVGRGIIAHSKRKQKSNLLIAPNGWLETNRVINGTVKSTEPFQTKLLEINVGKIFR